MLSKLSVMYLFCDAELSLWSSPSICLNIIMSLQCRKIEVKMVSKRMQLRAVSQSVRLFTLAWKPCKDTDAALLEARVKLVITLLSMRFSATDPLTHTISVLSRVVGKNAARAAGIRVTAA